MSRSSSKVKPVGDVQEEFDVEIQAVNKNTLLPKVGDALPIPSELVGCTQALFFEYRHQTTSDIIAPYCLKSHDHTYQDRVYRSMYLEYISCDSEYEAAIKILGNYSHWLKLKATSWFSPHLEAWNDELELRESALARSKLVTLTEAGNVTAARTLLGNKKNPVGKPKKSAGRKDDTSIDDLDAMLARTEGDSLPKH